MSKILIIADHDHGVLKDTTLRCVAAASKLGGELDLLVYGEAVGEVAKQASKISHVAKVLVADAPSLKDDLAEHVCDLILGLASGYERILFAAGVSGKNVAPRLSALLDCTYLSDVIEIDGFDVVTRPIYAGNALETVKISDEKAVYTIRPTAFDPVSREGAAHISAVDFSAKDHTIAFVSEEKITSLRPELGAARVVVSGGRALGSAEEFKAVIEPLADRLGAAVGASRAAVDAGFAPNDYQVGQTGKVVAPELYLAIGISGAIQHLAGMKDSKIIVAINKDPEAPIFSVADYGLVEDYKTAIPALLTALS